MSDNKIDTSNWGYWEWYGLYKVVVQKQSDTTIKKLGLISPIYEKITQQVGDLKMHSSELVSLNADPRLEQLWLDRLGTFNNCGRSCSNFQGRMTKDDRCKTCGANFLDGVPEMVCQECGCKTDALFGHIMGDLSFCKSCNEAKRLSSGGPCRMCNKLLWNCCC